MSSSSFSSLQIEHRALVLGQFSSVCSACLSLSLTWSLLFSKRSIVLFIPVIWWFVWLLYIFLWCATRSSSIAWLWLSVWCTGCEVWFDLLLTFPIVLSLSLISSKSATGFINKSQYMIPSTTAQGSNNITSQFIIYFFLFVVNWFNFNISCWSY